MTHLIWEQILSGLFGLSLGVNILLISWIRDSCISRREALSELTNKYIKMEKEECNGG